MKGNLRKAAILVVLLVLLPVGAWLITMSTDIDPGMGLFGGFVLGVIIAAVMFSKPAGDIEP